VKRKCKVCPTTIILARNVKNNRIVPLDDRAPIYRVWFDEKEDDFLCEQVVKGDPVNPGEHFRVTHFASCRGVDAIKRDQRKQRD
jgi:hypothetical protein